jgi:2-methylcitrate dehydratase PrpD
MMKLPNYPEPRTGLEGKFSVGHVAAVALVDRAAGIAQFTDERVADAALAQLRRKVTVEVGQELEIYQVRVAVHTTDGRELCHFVPIQKGDYRNPLSRDELLAKFRANASAVLPPDQTETIIAKVWEIEAIGDIAELMQLSRPRKGPNKRRRNLPRE